MRKQLKFLFITMLLLAFMLSNITAVTSASTAKKVGRETAREWHDLERKVKKVKVSVVGELKDARRFVAGKKKSFSPPALAKMSASQISAENRKIVIVADISNPNGRRCSFEYSNDPRNIVRIAPGQTSPSYARKTRLIAACMDDLKT